jgi:hypothetical protein
MSHELHEQREHFLYAEEVLAIQDAIFELKSADGCWIPRGRMSGAPKARIEWLIL